MERSGEVFTVRIDHHVHDFAAWKAAFDRDPARRQASGVWRYRISRKVDDPALVTIDLEFDTAGKAERFLAAMRAVWQGPGATAVLRDGPQAQIVRVVERREY